MLVTDAISRAYRDANLTTVGQAPIAAEQAEAVQLLNVFWTALLGAEVGEELVDWYIPPPVNTTTPPANLIGPLTDNLLLGSAGAGAWYLQPIQNSRVLMTLTGALTIFMPQFPDPGARVMFRDIGSSAVTINLSGNGHTVGGQQILSGVTPQFISGKTYLFRDDLSSWQEIVPIKLTDTSFPLDPAYDDLWITWLALRLMPSAGQASDPVVLAIHKYLLSKVRNKYRNFQATAVNDPRTSQGQQSYRNNNSGW